MAYCNNSICFSSIDVVKKDKRAIAILLDIDYYTKRASTEIIKDISLPKEEGKHLLSELDKHIYIRPNPHRNVMDIHYVLAEKGKFLINGLRAKNPKLFEGLDAIKQPKLSQFT